LFIFSYLLKNGANPNYKDASGYSMIYTLARAGFKDNRKEELFYAKELLKYNVIITKEDIEWAKKSGKLNFINCCKIILKIDILNKIEYNINIINSTKGLK